MVHTIVRKFLPSMFGIIPAIQNEPRMQTSLPSLLLANLDHIRQRNNSFSYWKGPPIMLTVNTTKLFSPHFQGKIINQEHYHPDETYRLGSS